MTSTNIVRDRFIADLSRWLTPDLLYHCFTGEDDPYRLAHIAKLEPSLLEPLLNKAEREWPARLQRIAEQRRAERQQSKQAVQQFVLGIKP
jgi:hypothetical protein